MFVKTPKTLNEHRIGTPLKHLTATPWFPWVALPTQRNVLVIFLSYHELNATETPALQIEVSIHGGTSKSSILEDFLDCDFSQPSILGFHKWKASAIDFQDLPWISGRNPLVSNVQIPVSNDIPCFFNLQGFHCHCRSGWWEIHSSPLASAWAPWAGRLRTSELDFR